MSADAIMWRVPIAGHALHGSRCWGVGTVLRGEASRARTRGRGCVPVCVGIHLFLRALSTRLLPRSLAISDRAISLSSERRTNSALGPPTLA